MSGLLIVIEVDEARIMFGEEIFEIPVESVIAVPVAIYTKPSEMLDFTVLFTVTA